MKLLELEIINTRGIRSLQLKPDGKNYVVWGPNGSGKSGVVDSLDFLLTGKINRLTGQGTRNITLAKHGPHIDCNPEDAIVRAIVLLPGISEPVKLERCLANPAKLIYEPVLEERIKPIITLANRGQHVLTRREILRYITSEGSKRAEEIQELLNIKEIEDIRRALVKAKNEISATYETAKRVLSTAESAITVTINKTPLSSDAILEVVNINRAVLGAAPISEYHSTRLKEAITLPTALTSQHPVNATLLGTDIQNLKDALSEENQEKIGSFDKEIRSIINRITSDPSLLRAFSTKRLVEAGLGLLDDTGECPLCNTPWEREKLQKHLEGKLSSAIIVEKDQKQSQYISEELSAIINAALIRLKKVIAAAKVVNLEHELAALEKWQNDLEVFLNSVVSPIEKYIEHNQTPDLVKRLNAPENILQIIDTVLAAVQANFPQSTPEQSAWDILTRLEENLKAAEKATIDHGKKEQLYKRACVLAECFERARDNVLSQIYESIKDRFVSLYRGLHGTDEEGFDASLRPEGAALNLEVGFYGRGKHPPHALHSEGHQDSMGLCLYLSLAEKLTENLIELTILDDVVMSVDADHRRELCKLLAKEFPHRQFLITTHDKTWTNQLKTEGVVNSKGVIEFYNWNVESGPQFHCGGNIWDRIKEDILRGDVNGAAAKLRRGSEEFFSFVCDALEAPVKFRSNGRWELGDLLPSGVNQYKEYLKKAKVAAGSWNAREQVEALSEIESIINQVYARSNAEQWAVNASVHYNNWYNLTPQDFRPVAEAFQDLHALFICSSCEGMMRLTKSGLTHVGIVCNCGKFSWNLQAKGK